jgi:hypothetical protein
MHDDKFFLRCGQNAITESQIHVVLNELSELTDLLFHALKCREERLQLNQSREWLDIRLRVWEVPLNISGLNGESSDRLS